MTQGLYFNRSVARIDKILGKLGEIWKRHPEWSFGELIRKTYTKRCAECEKFCWKTYLLEDDPFSELLKELVNGGRK